MCISKEVNLHKPVLSEVDTQKKMIDTPIMKHPAETQGLKRSPVTSDDDKAKFNHQNVRQL